MSLHAVQPASTFRRAISLAVTARPSPGLAPPVCGVDVVLQHRLLYATRHSKETLTLRRIPPFVTHLMAIQRTVMIIGEFIADENAARYCGHC